MDSIFTLKNPDFNLSPYTGMTREEWIRAGEHLLTGIFQNIKDFKDPVVMPRKETKITYPHDESPAVWHEAEKRAEMFEGLTRSLFIAAPLLKNNPGLELCGYKIADYYKSHILRSCTSGDPVSVSSYHELQELTHHEDPFRAFQQTVETCALVIGLWVSREVIWETYDKKEQDTIAEFLTSFAHANTVPQNWRLFNMLDMAFLHMYGYPIDKDIMMDHASEILNYYAGDGWYRDGHCFDYYSCWAFQVYAPLWNRWYGYENAPDIAAEFEKNSNELMKTYSDFFDEDGHTNMWGRSNIYRCAAASAFEGNFNLSHPTANPGLARRICSGSLLQFITREDFYYKGIPTMGFYGQFSPLVQGYSCAESPFWLGKIFLCLDLPKDHPFWTATEENGSWEKLLEKEVKTTVLDGPALCFTNHKANGTTNLRTGKIVKNNGDEHAMWNYGKLCYNSKYPWESTPQKNSSHPYSIESQQYVLVDDTNQISEKCNVTLWHGQKKGVLYRRQYFNYTLDRECMWMQAVSLADFEVPYGIIRTDRIRLFRRPVTLTLGSFGFPDNDTTVDTKEKTFTSSDGSTHIAKAVILKGRDSIGNKKQLAYTIFDGWDEIKLCNSKGTNPESENSIIPYAITKRTKQYGSNECYMLMSQTLTKENHEDFSEEELFPITDIHYSDDMKTGGYGTIFLTLSDGSKKDICFSNMEGNLLL